MIVTEKEFRAASLIVFQYKQQILNQYKSIDASIGSVNKKSDLIIESNLSVRSLNVLCQMTCDDARKRGALSLRGFWHSMKISDLRNVSVVRLSKRRCCGKKSIEEIKELAASAGIKLKD